MLVYSLMILYFGITLENLEQSIFIVGLKRLNLVKFIVNFTICIIIINHQAKYVGRYVSFLKSHFV